MNLSSFRSFKCKRIPAAILLSAIVTASPAVTYQARVEPLENEVSESTPDEILLPADESTDELIDSSVPEVPKPEPDISVPDPIETVPGQDTGGSDPAEAEPAEDSSVPEVPAEVENPPEESFSDESASDAAGEDQSEPDRPADESLPEGGKKHKPSKKEETKPAPDKPSEELQSGTESESPAPENAADLLPEQLLKIVQNARSRFRQYLPKSPCLPKSGGSSKRKRWKNSS